MHGLLKWTTQAGLITQLEPGSVEQEQQEKAQELTSWISPEMKELAENTAQTSR